MNNKQNRRDFLKKAGMGTAGVLFTSHLLSLKAFSQVADPMKQYDYSGWENYYRNMWKYDKVTRGTHLLNCTGSCPHFVYSKDGVIIREEQSNDMPHLTTVPENNPRGCNKGLCAVDYVYGPHRVKYPLMRVGERGEGKWKRISWDEAITKIAEKCLDEVQTNGPDTISVFSPVPAVSPVSFSAGHRFAHLFGGYTYTFFDWYSDHPAGLTMTTGLQGDMAETSDFYNAKYIIFWGANFNTTRIPDAHYMQEARYNGAKIVNISPEYSSTAIHSDIWVHPKPGTDGAIALAMAHVIIKEKLYKEHYLKEQTDMPMLVRMDNNKFLREIDLVEGGNDAKFYTWDTKSMKPVLMKGCWGEEPEKKPPIQPGFMGRNTFTFPEGTLDLGMIDPALEGVFEVKLKNGKTIKVRPVFEIFKKILANDYSPKKVAEITGVNEKVISQMGRDYATLSPAMIVSGGGTNHWFYSDQTFRSFMFVNALTGNTGKQGGGLNHYVGEWKITPLIGMAKLAFPKSPGKHRFVNTAMWVYKHAEIYEELASEDPQINKYFDMTLEKKQFPMYPRNNKDPKVFICYRGNWLNNAKGLQKCLDILWPKLDLIVTLNFRMDSQALYSDIVLPAAHWYEKLDLNMTGEHSFIQVTEPAAKPVGEAKSDWEIFVMLAKKVSEISKKRGGVKYNDVQFDWNRAYCYFYDEFVDNGNLDTDEKACKFVLANAPHTKGITLEQLRRFGPQRFKENWTSKMEDNVPYSPFKHFVELKKPYPTMVGRQQYYIDHEWFLELGEELPKYKAPLEHDKYPLRFNTLHGRHGMHSTWKDNILMLRLHRGGPLITMSPKDAADRNLKDNDWIKAFNKHGNFICRVKIIPGAQDGHVNAFCLSELYTNAVGNSQSPLPVRLNPTTLAGGYGQFVFKPNYFGPAGHQRDVRVEVEKYDGKLNDRIEKMKM